jgi:hypothetical protein
MPRIISFRTLGLWCAFTLDDYGNASYVSWALTRHRAENRCISKEMNE